MFIKITIEYTNTRRTKYMLYELNRPTAKITLPRRYPFFHSKSMKFGVWSGEDQHTWDFMAVKCAARFINCVLVWHLKQTCARISTTIKCQISYHCRRTECDSSFLKMKFGEIERNGKIQAQCIRAGCCKRNDMRGGNNCV